MKIIYEKKKYLPREGDRRELYERNREMDFANKLLVELSVGLRRLFL
jgi:hypothetical protein